MPECAAGCVRVMAALALALGCSCEQHAAQQSSSSAALALPAPQLEAAEQVAPPRAAVPPAPAELLAGTFMLQSDILRGLGRARLLRVRPVGSTSTVFRSELDVPFRAAFKLPTTQRPNAALNEVAAYRLARCLGLANVPPAVLRRVSKDVLWQTLEPSFAEHWPEIEQRLVVDRAGFVEGALIFWIDELTELGLDSPLELTRYLEWLQIDGELPEENALLAAQMSTLLAFDWLTGNWDRWSGANLRGDPSGRVIYMRDNDAAFSARLPEGVQRHMLEPMQQTQLYSRSFVKAVRALSRESLQAELDRDPEYAARQHRPLIAPQAMTALFDRRDALLSHLAALIDEYGEERVLRFP
jgi:hypothetical protein